jgi:nucleoside phosphorylase
VIWLGHQLAGRDPLLARKLEDYAYMLQPSQVDVLVVTSTDVETLALRRALTRRAGEPVVVNGPINTYNDYGPIGGAQIAHLRTTVGSGGLGGSSQAVGDAIDDRHPAAVIAVGIAFGVDEATQPIGEVLVSERLSPYELQRVGEDAEGNVTIRDRGVTSEGSPRLLSRFRDSGLERAGVRLRVGQLLSGAKLIDSAPFKAALLSRYPDAIGGEMEGAGLLDACGRRGVDWLVVKAVCDYAENKGQDKDLRQALAARQAVRALVTVLESGGLTRGQ